jgi:hypothetical protein
MTRGITPRPAPEDFQQVAAGKPTKALCEIYGCGPDMIYRWRRETNSPFIPHAPADFVTLYQTMTLEQLRKHYDRGWLCIKRWEKETGATRPPKPAKPAKQPAVRLVKATKASSTPLRPNAFQNVPVDRVQRDMSPVGQAADYLRRFGPVYRCDVKGRPLADGFFWRRGTAILTDQDLIERADWMRRKEAA